MIKTTRATLVRDSTTAVSPAKVRQAAGEVKMIKGLKMFSGAKPGRVVAKPKRVNTGKVYEDEKRVRVFLDSWKEGRPWLEYNNDTGKSCSDVHYNITGSNSTNDE